MKSLAEIAEADSGRTYAGETANSAAFARTTEWENMKKSRLLVLALIATFVVGMLAGCSFNPNVRKQKYLESGLRYYQKGKYREAVIQFSNAIKVDPRFASAHYQLAESYAKLGIWQSAYNELQRTVDLQPSNLNAQLQLGALLLGSH